MRVNSRKTRQGLKEYSLGRRIWKYRESYQLMAPFMLLFMLFTLIPVIAAIVLSFTDFNMLSSWTGWAFKTMNACFLTIIFFDCFEKHACFCIAHRPAKLFAKFFVCG